MSVAPPDRQVNEVAPPSQPTARRLPGPPPGWLLPGALSLLAAGGLAMFLVPLRGIDLNRMNGLGLISVLPASSLAGAWLLALAFILALGLRKDHPVMLGAMLAAIVICLDGVTVIAEPEPRFATAYQIAGFVEYISRTGHTAPGIAAYFSWPGFFALVVFVEGVAGKHDLIPVLRLWPVTIDLLCLPPLFLIMRNLRMIWRAKWFAAFLFCVGSWVGQDYFSPQSFNYLLYLLFAAFLLTWFSLPALASAQRDRPVRDRLAGRLARFGREGPPGRNGTGRSGTALPACSHGSAGAACPSRAKCRAGRWAAASGRSSSRCSSPSSWSPR